MSFSSVQPNTYFIACSIDTAVAGLPIATPSSHSHSI